MCRERLPGWQQKFRKHDSDEFTVVGLALDAEGIAPAQNATMKKHGVTFPALVDPNYATQSWRRPEDIFR